MNEILCFYRDKRDSCHKISDFTGYKSIEAYDMLKKLLFLLVVVMFLGLLLARQSFCQNCASEGEPCSQDEKLGKCCLTYTNTEGKTRKLKCSTEPETENTCVDDGPVE